MIIEFGRFSCEGLETFAMQVASMLILTRYFNFHPSVNSSKILLQRMEAHYKFFFHDMKLKLASTRKEVVNRTFFQGNFKFRVTFWKIPILSKKKSLNVKKILIFLIQFICKLDQNLTIMYRSKFKNLKFVFLESRGNSCTSQ